MARNLGPDRADAGDRDGRLAENPNDIPFALVYLLADDGRTAWLAETVRLEKGAAAAPAEIELNSEGDVWRFRRVLETGQSQTIENLAEKFGHLTAGAWVGDATQKAGVLPLARAVTHRIYGQEIYRVRIEFGLDAARLAKSNHQEPYDQQQHERSCNLRHHQQVAQTKSPVTG